MKLLIIIPAYNEELNIKRVVDNLINNYPQYDYVVVNDGTKDKTSQICEENNYNLINLPINLGLTGAVQAGMRYALKNNYDAVLQYDGDGQHRAEYIQELINASESADIVIGSRFVNEKKPRSLRMLGSNLISTIIRLTTGKRISDPTSGMRLYTRKMIERFAYEINFQPEPDTISYAIKCGIRISEIQVYMDERVAGESYLNFIKSIKYMMLMVTSILFVQQFREVK